MRPSPARPFAAAVVAAAALILVVVAAACATQQAPPPPGEPAGVPAWLGVDGVERAADLDRAAAMLCARTTDGVIDDEVRAATGVVDGAVVGLYGVGATVDEARGKLGVRAAALATPLRATHVGVAEGTTARGEECAAFVAARRRLTIVVAPPARLSATTPFTWRAKLTGGKATGARAYLMSPDGSVARADLDVDDGILADQVTPKRGPGNYVLEVIVDDGRAPDVALLWPFVVGAPKRAPSPEVLFPDEGHPDLALTRRAEALVIRLRDEQQLEPLRLWPVLSTVAQARAAAIAGQGALEHVQRGKNAAEDTAALAPDAKLSKLAEVQAMGASLTDAWTALLQSPAHRFELVDGTVTHMGVAVVRGLDGAGRPMVALDVVLVRKPVLRDPRIVEETILNGIDEVRVARGLDALKKTTRLDRLAQRLVENMASRGVVDEAGLGEPVANVALQEDASLTEVRPVLARLDDPLHLEVPLGALEIDMSSVGFGIAQSDRDHLWYVVLLLGVGGS